MLCRRRPAEWETACPPGIFAARCDRKRGARGASAGTRDTEAVADAGRPQSANALQTFYTWICMDGWRRSLILVRGNTCAFSRSRASTPQETFARPYL